MLTKKGAEAPFLVFAERVRASCREGFVCRHQGPAANKATN
jgi:hypothetical protein